MLVRLRKDPSVHSLSFHSDSREHRRLTFYSTPVFSSKDKETLYLFDSCVSTSLFSNSFVRQKPNNVHLHVPGTALGLQLITNLGWTAVQFQNEYSPSVALLLSVSTHSSS